MEERHSNATKILLDFECDAIDTSDATPNFISGPANPTVMKEMVDWLLAAISADTQTVAPTVEIALSRWKQFRGEQNTLELESRALAEAQRRGFSETDTLTRLIYQAFRQVDH